jgi:hypothetical protein
MKVAFTICLAVVCIVVGIVVATNDPKPSLNQSQKSNAEGDRAIAAIKLKIARLESIKESIEIRTKILDNYNAQIETIANRMHDRAVKMVTLTGDELFQAERDPRSLRDARNAAEILERKVDVIMEIDVLSAKAAAQRAEIEAALQAEEKRRTPNAPNLASPLARPVE